MRQPATDPAPDLDPDSHADPDPDLDPDPDPDADSQADARALASTLRMRILRLCLDRSLTNREIADRLGKNPATVLHHVRTLVTREFLVAEPVRRGARGSREVPYRATGKSWRMSPFPGMRQVMVDTFLEEVAEAPEDAVWLTRLGVRLSSDEHAELLRRIEDFFAELAGREPTEDGDPYSILLALHLDTGRV